MGQAGAGGQAARKKRAPLVSTLRGKVGGVLILHGTPLCRCTGLRALVLCAALRHVAKDAVGHHNAAAGAPDAVQLAARWRGPGKRVMQLLLSLGGRPGSRYAKPMWGKAHTKAHSKIFLQQVDSLCSACISDRLRATAGRHQLPGHRHIPAGDGVGGGRLFTVPHCIQRLVYVLFLMSNAGSMICFKNCCSFVH